MLNVTTVLKSDDVTLADLTQADVAGEGVFDVLMRSIKGHLAQEYSQNRIRGPEYSALYLGALQETMQISLNFLLQRKKINLEAKVLENQVKITEQQLINMQDELLTSQKQREKIVKEIENLGLQGLLLTQQRTNLQDELISATKQREKLDKEIALLEQKTRTEAAQVTGQGVDPDSVLGRQKALYLAQSEGFKRDAEQKVAKLMADTWNVRRTTDDATQANTTNMLDDASIGRVMTTLLAGINA